MSVSRCTHTHTYVHNIPNICECECEYFHTLTHIKNFKIDQDVNIVFFFIMCYLIKKQIIKKEQYN